MNKFDILGNYKSVKGSAFSKISDNDPNFFSFYQISPRKTF